jgi:hypothetical protein
LCPSFLIFLHPQSRLLLREAAPAGLLKKPQTSLMMVLYSPGDTVTVSGPNQNPSQSKPFFRRSPDAYKKPLRAQAVMAGDDLPVKRHHNPVAPSFSGGTAR